MMGHVTVRERKVKKESLYKKHLDIYLFFWLHNDLNFMLGVTYSDILLSISHIYMLYLYCYIMLKELANLSLYMLLSVCLKKNMFVKITDAWSF